LAAQEKKSSLSFVKAMLSLFFMHVLFAFFATAALTRDVISSSGGLPRQTVIIVVTFLLYLAIGLSFTPQSSARRNAMLLLPITALGLLIWGYCLAYVRLDLGHETVMGPQLIWIFYMFYVNPGLFSILPPLFGTLEVEGREWVLALWSFLPSIALWAGLELKRRRSTRRWATPNA
jgi:hypothetical protein